MIRRAVATDIEALVALERAHGRDELGTQGGALDAELYDSKALGQLIDSELVMVAQDKDTIVGYAVVASARFYGRHGFYSRLFNRASQSCLDNHMPAANLGCYGPVWVAPSHRGKGIFAPLFRGVVAASVGMFDTLFTFIAEENEHSLNVHVKSGGMQVVDFFELERRGFYLLLKALD